VASAEVFHFAVETALKPVPYMFSVKAVLPATATPGLRMAIVGSGGLMVKTAAEELPVMLLTVTLAVPTLAIRAAGTVAVICVALMNVAANCVAPKATVEVEVKLLPFTVSVKAAPPAMALAGLRLVIVGAGGLTVKATPRDIPLTLLTVMLAVQKLAIRLAGIAAVNCFELTNETVNGVAFHRAVEAEVKLVPLTVSVKAVLPAMADAGLRLSIEGGGGRTVKASVDEIPLRSFTVMLVVPALTIREAGTTAVSCSALTYFVTSAVVPHIAFEVEVKFEPLMVSVKPLPPAMAELGFSEEVAGGGPTENEKLGDDEPMTGDFTMPDTGFALSLDA